MRGRSVSRLLALALLTVLAIVGIWTLSPVKYQARAMIHISPIIPYLVFKTEDTGLMPLYDSFVNTQANIIKGPLVLERALDAKAVQNTQWFKNPRRSLKERVMGYRVPRIERLRDNLVVRPQFKTEFMFVMMEDPNAEDARAIVQAVVEAYENYAASESSDTRSEFNTKLVSEYNRLKQSVEVHQKACFDLQEQLGTNDPDRLLSNRSMALDETKTALATVQQDISNLALQIEKALGGDAKSSGVDAIDTAVARPEETKSQPKYYTDAEWSRLDTAVQNAQRAIKISPLKPSHPNWAAMAKDLEFAVQLLRKRQEQLDEQWLLANRLPPLASDPNSLSPEERLEFWETQLEILKNQEKNLIVDLRKKEEEYNRLFTIAQELKRETEILQHQRGLFAAVQARKDAKDMERNSSLGRIKVMPAVASFTPHNDRRFRHTGIALAIFLILAGGMAIRHRKRMDKAG